MKHRLRRFIPVLLFLSFSGVGWCLAKGVGAGMGAIMALAILMMWAMDDSYSSHMDDHGHGDD